ncbi:MAG: phage tail sheath subtilisin-like domain-containing protein [Pseudomonadota bacterium]
MYKHPGVYIEHIPSGLLAIEAASASTAVFVGPVPRGPVGEPVFITGVAGYAATFGEAGGGAIRDLGAEPDYFGHAVTSFFDNGGAKAYVVRVGKSDTPAQPATAAITDPSGGVARGLYMTAENPGTWGNRLAATLEAIDAAHTELGYVLKVGTVKMKGSVATLEPLEIFRPVFMDEANSRFVGAVVAKESALINLERKRIGTASGGGRITAVRSGSLATLGVVKGTKLKLSLNTVAIEIDFADPLINVSAKRGTTTRTTTPDVAAVTTIEALAPLIQQAVRMHTDFAGFRAYVDEDHRLVLVPPPVGPGDTAAVVITDSDATSTAQAPLKLMPAPERTELDHPVATGSLAYFFNGTAGGDPGKDDYAAAFHKLRDYRDAAIIVLPGKTWTTATKDIVQTAIAHAEFMQNAMVIIDPPDQVIETPNQVSTLAVEESPYAALYHPWLEVTNPHYDPDIAANRPVTFKVPPSAVLAGLWARIDATRGIWKAPAGLEASIRGTRGVTRLIGNDIQDNLNELGVNCIRSITGPPVVWGARTLATRAKPEFRYISVRRTQNLIGESLYRALQAVVFEPNNDFLWASLRASVGGFMDGLWRAGAFQGAKSSDAYYVRCGLGATMTQGDIDGGIVRVVVGFAPLKPAEFVVVQVQQIVGQTG